MTIETRSVCNSFKLNLIKQLALDQFLWSLISCKCLGMNWRIRQEMRKRGEFAWNRASKSSLARDRQKARLLSASWEWWFSIKYETAAHFLTKADYSHAGQTVRLLCVLPSVSSPFSLYYMGKQFPRALCRPGQMPVDHRPPLNRTRTPGRILYSVAEQDEYVKFSHLNWKI